MRRGHQERGVRGAAAGRHRLGGTLTTDVPGGVDALGRLDYCSTGTAPARTPTQQLEGAARDVPGQRHADARHDLRVAYIWSSEEAASVADARERALAKAEEALSRIRNGIGGRYYKTRTQVDARVAEILSGPVKDLLTVTTDNRAGKPTITWARNPAAIDKAGDLDGLYAVATNLPDPARPPTDCPRGAPDLQGPMDRRTAPPRPQTNPPGPSRVLTQR